MASGLVRAFSSALFPAATAKVRKSLSAKAPKGVFPAPATTTWRPFRMAILYTEHSARDLNPRLTSNFRHLYQEMEIIAPLALMADRNPALSTVAPEVQERFVSEHLRRIFLQIYRMVGNVHDAQDLTQEAF